MTSGDTTATVADYRVSHSRNVYLMSAGGNYLTRFKYGTDAKRMAATIRKAIDRLGMPTKTG